MSDVTNRWLLTQNFHANESITCNNCDTCTDCVIQIVKLKKMYYELQIYELIGLKN